MGSKDKNPRKRKVTNSRNDLIDNRNIQEKVMDTTSGKNVEETQVYEDNNEISINYTMTGKRWNRINVVVDNIFVYNIISFMKMRIMNLNLLTNVVIERIGPSGKKSSKQN